jgi:hypothetical protein
MDSAGDMKRKPFSISDVNVFEQKEMPEPMNKMKRELAIVNPLTATDVYIRQICIYRGVKDMEKFDAERRHGG